MTDTASLPPVSLELAITGMTCGGCASRVEDALASVPGVLRVRVDLGEAVAHLSLDPTRATPERLLAAVKAAGYAGTLVAG